MSNNKMEAKLKHTWARKIGKFLQGQSHPKKNAQINNLHDQHFALLNFVAVILI